MEKIRIYVVARIAKEFHAWTDQVCAPIEQDGSFDVFKPKDFNPWWLPPEKIESSVVDMDYQKIDESHIGLVLPNYGRDCACEIGYYYAWHKPIVLFMDDQIEWMTHGHLVASLVREGKLRSGCVVTVNPATYELIRSHSWLGRAEAHLINNVEELPQVLKGVYRNKYEQGA